jgi:hypothetical protein
MIWLAGLIYQLPRYNFAVKQTLIQGRFQYDKIPDNMVNILDGRQLEWM